VYQAPTLEHIGNAGEAIQGHNDFGGDAWGELDWLEQEFCQD
jgi:hypothetical protein